VSGSKAGAFGEDIWAEQKAQDEASAEPAEVVAYMRLHECVIELLFASGARGLFKLR
jgi:hypothetical protein